VREDPRDHLAGHEDEDQREREPEATRILPGAAMRVPVRVVVHRSIMHACGISTA
jgi:hypothetical protein